MSNLKAVRSDYVLIGNGESQSLPDIPCNSVLLHASSVLLDDSRITPDANGSFKTLGNEILWGLNGKNTNQLFVTESIEIGVSNANQITFECFNPTDSQILSFTCFK